MSGGGSSREGGSTSGGGPATATPCDQLTFKARLQSPQPTVVALLNLGDELAVELTSDPVVRAVSPKGVAGHITTRLPELIACINSGHEYIAVVDVVDDGNIEVTVRPAS